VHEDVGMYQPAAMHGPQVGSRAREDALRRRRSAARPCPEQVATMVVPRVRRVCPAHP
jgi:hypothetical protein